MGYRTAAGLRAGHGFWLYGDVSQRGSCLCGLRRDGLVFLPSMRKEPKIATGHLEAPRTNRRDALLLFIICTLMWGINSLYIINMPLFIINELHLPEKLAGVMMGTAAGLEIPTMLIAGYYAKRFGKRFLMRISAVVEACCFTLAC